MNVAVLIQPQRVYWDEPETEPKHETKPDESSLPTVYSSLLTDNCSPSPSSPNLFSNFRTRLSKSGK